MLAYKHCPAKVLWQNRFVSQVSWQGPDITCTRFLRYPNPCLLAGSSARQKGCCLAALTLSCRKQPLRARPWGAPGLQSSAGTQLEAQGHRAKSWGTYLYPDMVLETSQYFSLLQNWRLPNKPSYNPIKLTKVSVKQAGPCMSLTQSYLDLLSSHVDSQHM